MKYKSMQFDDHVIKRKHDTKSIILQYYDSLFWQTSLQQNCSLFRIPKINFDFTRLRAYQNTGPKRLL
jgi:hypothetical protein